MGNEHCVCFVFDQNSYFGQNVAKIVNDKRQQMKFTDRLLHSIVFDREREVLFVTLSNRKKEELKLNGKKQVPVATCHLFKCLIIVSSVKLIALIGDWCTFNLN